MSNTNRYIEDYRSTLERYYEKGLEDAWELANKISDIYSASERARIFNYVVGGITVMDILRDFTPQEALAKLKAYEKEQEEKRKAEEMAVINVGDVVEYDGVQAVVMDIDIVDNVALFTENACIESWLPQCTFKKIGKHIDISSILQQLGSDADELS